MARLQSGEARRLSWHDLRHTWASWHVQNGTPLAVLQELGGRRDLKMVLLYAHLAPGHPAPYASNSGLAKPQDDKSTRHKTGHTTPGLRMMRTKSSYR
jgi:hypothetical protein